MSELQLFKEYIMKASAMRANANNFQMERKKKSNNFQTITRMKKLHIQANQKERTHLSSALFSANQNQDFFYFFYYYY